MGKTRNQKFELSLIQLVPNMMTIAAICLGITAIKHGFEGKFQSAVQLILLASVLAVSYTHLTLPTIVGV